jgi:tetratricopeptide (TPR) repeat protein
MAPTLVAAVLFVTSTLHSATRSSLELRGEIVPHQTGSVELHAVTSPFVVSALAGQDGRFRFKNLRAGAYTLLVAIRSKGEVWKTVGKTVEISNATADSRGRLALRIEVDGDAANRESSATVSAQEWRIPGSALREFEEARKRIGKRDFGGARLCLQHAVEIEPRFSAAWNHLGTMAYQENRYDEAEADFRRGLEGDSQAYEPLVNLGGVLLNLGRAEEALRYNHEAVRRRPTDALAQSQLGMTYALLNQLDLSEKHLALAVHFDPDHFSHPQLSLAEVYRRRNKPLEAAQQLQDFLRRHPDWPAAEKMKQQIAEWQSQSNQE